MDYQSEQIVSGQQVGVTISGAKSEHKNVAWTVGTDGALTNTDDAVYYSGNNEAIITVYHPYNSTWTGTSHAFSVSKDQSNEANYRNSDLLWATKTATKSEEAVALTFAHLSKECSFRFSIPTPQAFPKPLAFQCFQAPQPR